MDPISLVKQGWYVGTNRTSMPPEPGNVTINSKVSLNNVLDSIETTSRTSILFDENETSFPVVRSPLAFAEEFPEIILQLYGEQAEKLWDIAKFIFKFIEKIAQKLGGWDKLIDIVMMLFPLPKHVKIVLEVLKKILPLICSNSKTAIGEFMCSALLNGQNTDSPEQLLKKMVESFSEAINDVPFVEQQEAVAKKKEYQSIQDIMADNTISLEDKVMMVLMTMAERQEGEILDQAKKMDSASPESRQRLMIELQMKVQKLTQTISALSNMIKTFHEASMNSIRNFR